MVAVGEYTGYKVPRGDGSGQHFRCTVSAPLPALPQKLTKKTWPLRPMSGSSGIYWTQGLYSLWKNLQWPGLCTPRAQVQQGAFLGPLLGALAQGGPIGKICSGSRCSSAVSWGIG